MTELNELVVRVKQGQIQGIKQRSPIFHCEYYSFYGVPYAQPPIKDLRFKVSSIFFNPSFVVFLRNPNTVSLFDQDPVKVNPWKGIRNATTPRDACIQLSPMHGRMMGSEDCLHVNIYTPQVMKYHLNTPLAENQLYRDVSLYSYLEIIIFPKLCLSSCILEV